MDFVTFLLSNIISWFFYIVKITWWIFIPAVLFLSIKQHWPDWLQNKTGSKKVWAVLEITPPPEVLKTPKAMENVLIGLAGGWKDMNKRDKYWRGDMNDSFGLELVCNNRNLKFYIRCEKKSISWVESKFYSQYPDAQIREIEDYTKNMPEMIPDAEWDIWGGAYGLVKKGKNDWVIPLKTYMDWDDKDEDRVISPMSQLAELSLHVGSDEYVIIQLIISPVVTEVAGVAEKEIKKMLGQEVEEKKSPVSSFVGSFSSFLGDFVANIFRSEMQWSGDEEKKEEKPQFGSSYFNLTKGEQEVIEAIQQKESKLKFETSVNCMYIYKKGSENKTRISDMNGFIRQFGDEALNGLRPSSGTYPTSNVYLFKKYKNRLRMRKLYFAFKTRWGGYIIPSYYLSVEEIASIFHLPGTVVQSMGMGRVRSKTVEPPRDLIS